MAHGIKNTAQFIIDNYYRYKNMVIEDSSLPSHDLYREILAQNPRFPVDIKYDDQGERIIIDNNHTVYAGGYDADPSTRSMFHIDRSITDEYSKAKGQGSQGFGCGSVIAIALMILAVVVVALMIL